MKITVIERLRHQAKRMQAMTDSLNAAVWAGTELIDNLENEVAMTLGIINQIEAETIAKVQETAAPVGQTNQADDAFLTEILKRAFNETERAEAENQASEAEQPVPDHMQDIVDQIARALKAKGFDVNIISVKLPKL